MVRQTGAVLGMLFLAHTAAAQFVQQGSKLVARDVAGAAQQGASVAISADGRTAIIGGPGDNSAAGAAWVFTNSGGVWSQQGEKLIGSGAVRVAWQGTSVAISADGNTALVGGPFDANNAGAVWVFTRSGGVWSQQGSKLVGTGAVGAALQGASVAISADGNTAIVGGPQDNSSVGAAWVFTRSGGVWAQQASKLVGSGAAGIARASQGSSVAISADGDTALVGGPADGNVGGPGWPNFNGAAWVFTRTGALWSQQGSKLVGTGAVGPSRQGTSAAISADGNTAIIGGPYDGSLFLTPPNGAAWVFTRSRGVWAQQGGKLVGAGAIGAAFQGASVAISTDGNRAIIGGPSDDYLNIPNQASGAAWLFTRSAGVWAQQSGKLVGTSAVGGAAQGESLTISADGSTAIVGGPYDNSGIGAAWVFVATGCASPSITSQPQDQSIVSGQAATLSVAATGAEPFSYRWFQGNAGDTSMPVGADASTFTTPPLESTASYWVWVLNACGTADSATATISVETRVRRHLQRAM